MRAMHDEAERSVQSEAAQPGVSLLRAVPDGSSDGLQRFGEPGRAACRAAAYRFRAPDVQVRVGDYKFDNTNFAGGGGGSRYDLGGSRWRTPTR